MQPFDKILQYTKSVCDQIRWKKAHSIISEEIEKHLIDQRDAYIAEGTDEIAATDQAITQMGDPVEIGTLLDRTHRPKPQWSMILLVMVLLSVGLLSRIAIGFEITPADLIGIITGLGCMTAAYLLDFTYIGKHPKIIYFSILALSIVVLILSPEINGRAYYAVFCTLLFPLGFAAIVYVAGKRGFAGIILCEISFLLPVCIAINIPTTSGFLLFALSGLVILTMGIARGWFVVNKLSGYLLVYVPTAALIMLAVVRVSAGGLWRRLQIVVNPSLDPMGDGYIGTLIRALLNGSKPVGTGQLSAEYSAAASLFPHSNAGTDYLLAYLTFKVGWIALILILGVLLFFMVKGYMLCFRQKSVLGLFVSMSVMLTFTLQVFGYVTANLGLIFSGPISLPLISYGNSANIVNLFLIGIMLSVFRTGDIARDERTEVMHNDSFITWSDGKLTISFGRK